MASNYVEWYIQLVNGRLNKPIDDDSGVYNVLTQNDPAEITVYSDDSGTSGSNPGTMTNGVIRFWTASSVTAVDISVLTSNGHAFFLEDVTQSDHRVVVWPDQTEYTLVIPYTYSGASATVVDTGFDQLANMLVKDCFIHVVTAGTGFFLDIGNSTDTDGFADGAAASTTGYPVTLLEEALVSTSSLIGALLANATGTNVRKLSVRANATSGANITYTNTSDSTVAGAGYIYLTYRRIPA